MHRALQIACRSTYLPQSHLANLLKGNSSLWSSFAGKYVVPDTSCLWPAFVRSCRSLRLQLSTFSCLQLSEIENVFCCRLKTWQAYSLPMALDGCPASTCTSKHCEEGFMKLQLYSVLYCNGYLCTDFNSLFLIWKKLYCVESRWVHEMKHWPQKRAHTMLLFYMSSVTVRSSFYCPCYGLCMVYRFPQK